MPSFLAFRLEYNIDLLTANDVANELKTGKSFWHKTDK
jgi:hypothetical protein